MLAVWQSHAGSWCAAREMCYSAAMDLRAKAFAGLQLQHPTKHLSVHKLCLKPVGKREKRRKDRAGCNCSDLVSRGHAEQKLSQQERTTTIRKRCSVSQAVKGEKWRLASSCK